MGFSLHPFADTLTVLHAQHSSQQVISTIWSTKQFEAIK